MVTPLPRPGSSASPLQRSPFREGEVAIGRYAIRRNLGAGSIGTVYLAEDRRSGRPVALKVIRADRLSSRAVVRLQREFKAIASLDHRQIAGARDFGYTETGGVPYYTREYIEGTPLPPGPPRGESPQEFLRPILDLLDALDCLHARDILHLDIHPGNLIVAADTVRGSVLIDFGLIPSPEGAGTPATGPASGLPPELLGTRPPSAATDLFLAGRLLLYRLTGETGPGARLPREIPGWGERLTLELERIAGKALESEPERRFQSAAELREALRRALGERPPEPRRSEPDGPLVARQTEMERIEAVLREAAAGRAASLFLVGPPGVGKTRLLEEARQRAQLLGLETATARFFPDPGADPLLIQTLEAISGGRSAKIPWLEALSAEHGGTPEDRAGRAVQACFEEGGRNLALILDDLDLADRESRVLAEAFIAEALERRKRADSGRGVAVLASSSGPGLLRIDRASRLRLRPLRPADSRRLFLALARPLVVPDSLARKAAARTKGFPLRLRQLARALRAEHGDSGLVPPGAGLPELPPDPIAAGLLSLSEVRPDDRGVLKALAVLRRPAGREEIAAALEIEPGEVGRSLKRLEKAELVRVIRRGKARLEQLSLQAAGEDLLGRMSAARIRRMHRRVAEMLRRDGARDLRSRENLARHLLLGGRNAEGIRSAGRIAAVLRERGLLDRAASLLEEAIPYAGDARTRFRLAEEASSLFAEMGDHDKGLALLEPLYPGRGKLSPREAVRIRRRLGVHYHRSGRVEEARKVFEETVRLADPARDLEDLVFIDSELAELYTLRGRLDEAGEACRRGLDRLQSLDRGDDFRERMAAILRASRGHLELRRMNLSLARVEFRAALRISRRFPMAAIRAVILNNLGIVENQLNRFLEARRSFRRAEKLLLLAGERRALISISCNLAVIAAKLGDRDEALSQLERARWLLRRFPGERLEFFVSYTRATVAGLFGDAAEVLEHLPAALKLSRKIGDLHLARFGEILLAEPRMACGRHHHAWKGLRALLAESGRSAEEAPAILRRQVHARLLLLAAILGRRRAARESQEALEAIPRTELGLLEAWNDLAIGLAGLLAGKPVRAPFEEALHAFTRYRVPAGAGLARLGLLAASLASAQEGAVEKDLRLLWRSSPASEPHRFLAVARPLLMARAAFGRGDFTGAREGLSEASGAIIGSPCLELDWQVEELRARLAQKEGDAAAARAHLERSLHTRDLLVDLLPAAARKRFLTHPRFAHLNELAARLDRSPRLHFSSARLRASASFEGMIGRSNQMVRIYQTLDRLREQEVPVLITGETGTGKELVARALHRLSARRRGPFFALHAGSLPAELFESELFGYERGAFTGAEESRPGLLESLSGGTLLLDGVSDLAPAAQAKLLRVLDSGRARRLGSARERPVDVRFVASSSASLEDLVREGRFRQDLYYRLKGVEIALPPLRERKGDLELLARHFLEEHARKLERPAPGIRPDALRLLERQEWPGNVRELEGVLLRALTLLSPGESLGARDLDPLLAPRAGERAKEEPLLSDERLRGRSLVELRGDLERAYLAHLYRETGGNLREMMEKLGVKRAYLYRWLRKVGLDIRDLRAEGSV